MSFQPEMHPNFNDTIGRSLGNKTEPHKERDFIKVREELLYIAT